MALLSMIHATAGFAGLASGLAIIIMPNKGNRTHKKMGTLYFTSMGFSSMLSVIMSVQLNHPIFLSIGGFTLYMLLAAYFSLPVRFEKLKKLLYPLTLVGIACGMYMIYTGIIFLVVFGALQLLLVLQDLRMIWSKNKCPGPSSISCRENGRQFHCRYYGFWCKCNFYRKCLVALDASYDTYCAANLSMELSVRQKEEPPNYKGLVFCTAFF